MKKMSRYSASVHLLILYRKEPVRGKRLSLESQFFSAQHPSNVKQIIPTEEWLLHPQVASETVFVLSCPVCYVLRSSTAEKQQGNPRLLPLAGCLKTLAAAQEAGGWPEQARCAPADFELDSCKSTHCYSPGTVWLTSRPKQHYSRSALRISSA